MSHRTCNPVEGGWTQAVTFLMMFFLAPACILAIYILTLCRLPDIVSFNFSMRPSRRSQNGGIFLADFFQLWEYVGFFFAFVASAALMLLLFAAFAAFTAFLLLYFGCLCCVFACAALAALASPSSSCSSLSTSTTTISKTTTATTATATATTTLMIRRTTRPTRARGPTRTTTTRRTTTITTRARGTTSTTTTTTTAMQQQEQWQEQQQQQHHQQRQKDTAQRPQWQEQQENDSQIKQESSQILQLHKMRPIEISLGLFWNWVFWNRFTILAFAFSKSVQLLCNANAGLRLLCPSILSAWRLLLWGQQQLKMFFAHMAHTSYHKYYCRSNFARYYAAPGTWDTSFLVPKAQVNDCVKAKEMYRKAVQLHPGCLSWFCGQGSKRVFSRITWNYMNFTGIFGLVCNICSFRGTWRL